MKVIFIKDLKKQGNKGETKEVSDGYARNFLIKNNHAIRATKESIERLKKEKQKNNINEQNEINKSKKTKVKLEKVKLVFKVKTGIKDKLFGSISTKQIYDELTEKGFKIDKKKILQKDSISTLGIYYVKIELHKEIIAKIAIAVEKEWGVNNE